MKPQPITFELIAQVASIFAVLIMLYKAYEYRERKNANKEKLKQKSK